jgi:hypothetical protein
MRLRSPLALIFGFDHHIGHMWLRSMTVESSHSPVLRWVMFVPRPVLSGLYLG